jgi:hypothetical protein
VHRSLKQVFVEKLKEQMIPDWEKKVYLKHKTKGESNIKETYTYNTKYTKFLSTTKMANNII